MKYAIACLLASSQAIKIRSSACPTDFKTEEGAGYTNQWTIGNDVCYGANEAPDCTSEQRNTARDGRTVAITEGDHTGCYKLPPSEGLAQTSGCPGDFEDAATDAKPNKWIIGENECYAEKLAPTCTEEQRNTARDGRSEAITEGDNAGCFQKPADSGLAQLEDCPPGFGKVESAEQPNEWDIAGHKCFHKKEAPVCTDEQRNTGRDDRTVEITEGDNKGCFKKPAAQVKEEAGDELVQTDRKVCPDGFDG